MKKGNLMLRVMSGVILMILAGCSGSDGPSGATIAAGLSNSFSVISNDGFSVSTHYYEFTDVDVLEQKQSGGEESKKYISKIKTKIVMNIDAYRLKEKVTIANKEYAIVENVVPKGSSFEASGTVISYLRGSANAAWWETQVGDDFDASSLFNATSGLHTLDNFTNPIIENSEEYKRLDKLKTEAKLKLESVMKSLYGKWEGLDSNAKSPVRINFKNDVIDIEYVGICKGTLSNPLESNDANISASNLLVKENVPQPCIVSTDRIVPIDDNHFRLEYMDANALPIEFYRPAYKQEMLKKLGKALSGTWKGHFVCKKGYTSLTLGIHAQEDGMMSAVFSFSPNPQNPTVLRGSYKMQGGFDVDGHISLIPNEWIKRPDGYRWVGMKGSIDDNSNKILSGVITATNCGEFEVKRISDH